MQTRTLPAVDCILTTHLKPMQIPIESLNLLMLNVGLARHNADWNWQDITSPFTRIYYVTDGEANLHLPDRTVALKPDYMYVVPAYTTHSYECHGRFEHYYLHVYEGFKNRADIFEYYDIPVGVMAGEEERHIFEKMCKKHPEARLPESDPQSYDNNYKFCLYVRRYNDMPLYMKMELRGSILTLLSRFMECASPRIWTHDTRLEKVLKFIHNNIYENIDIDDLADMACVTKSYLIRLFRTHFGISPLQYVNKKKMEKAQLLLLTEELTIKEIAYTLGFNDHSYFIRLFRTKVGSTPQEYRERMR